MLKQLVITIALVSFLGAFTMAQDQTTTDKTEKKECAKGCCSHGSKTSMTMAHMDMDSTHSDHKHHQMKSTETEEVSMIHKGEIDLVAIDINGDGMVYQDQMCWNVISDEAGECPQCGMTLKEVSLEKAKQNLLKHDYQVK
ncbi:MAG: heavy metal-binding domain-containing protein [Ignavibacteriaceae bacterium]